MKKLCCICGDRFSSSYKGKPYCNKHYLRMHFHGTPDKIGRTSTNSFFVEGELLIITTANGDSIKADAVDVDILKKHSWCISKAGYAVANINRKVVKMHRYILGDKCDGKMIDHINGNKIDNRRCNLRFCSAAENARNTSSTNEFGYPGIRKTKYGKYNARITVNRKEIHIGNFETVEEAIEARKQAEIKHFGEYAPCLGRYSEVENNEGSKQANPESP